MKNFTINADIQLAACYIAYEEISAIFAPQALTNRFITRCIVEKAVLSGHSKDKIRNSILAQLDKLPDDLLENIKDMRYKLVIKSLGETINICFFTWFEMVGVTIDKNGKVKIFYEEKNFPADAA